MPYNVFTDFHHASLLNSFILLFEKRLGGNVYRPIGMDWADKGFWKVYDHPATQQQYLTLDQGYRPVDGTRPLNLFHDVNGQVNESVYYCQDIDSGYYNKAITFEQFLQMPIDIVIASMPQHVQPFKRLIREYKPSAKLIYQIGNQWDLADNDVRNVMASARVKIPQGVNGIVYHQEFDTKVFQPRAFISKASATTLPEELPKTIYSFVNVFQAFPDWELFQRVESSMPDYSFKSYGGQCRDGSANGSEELAYKMSEAMFIWHTKEGGDGYGHVLHNSAAIGRPTIVKKSYYNGKLGENLLIDGKTCLDIDGLGIAQIVEKIAYYSEPERYAELCRNVYENFKAVCSFDAEFTEIRAFLDKLI